MGKFRSKIKGKPKGKRWLKGQSSNSNPQTHKYREIAKSRFFQENLGKLTKKIYIKTLIFVNVFIIIGICKEKYICMSINQISNIFREYWPNTGGGPET